QYEVRIRRSNGIPRDTFKLHAAESPHVGHVLVEWYGYLIDVLVMLEKHGRARAAAVCQPISVRRWTNNRTARDLAVALPLQKFEHRLDNSEQHTEPSGDIDAGKLTCKVE